MTAAPLASLLVVIDDEPDLRTLYELTLLREGYSVETAACVQEAKQALEEDCFDLIITDMRLPDGSGLDILKFLDTHGRDEKAMVITAYGSAESAVEALRAGAYDYLTKPVDLKQFRQAVGAALNSPYRQPHLTSAAPDSAPDLLTPSTSSRLAPAATSAAMSRLVGDSPAMVQVRALITKVARSMAPVRLWGESGTGKELVARAIHDVSVRADGPFVAVNCGAIPEHLLEAEFFGYRKGAFTGANDDRAGFFQAAQGGTLFLDEIGDLPLSMQAKLLRVVQERAVRPLGTVVETPCDVRIISASHKDLTQEVHDGRFRQDLFYRLNVILISLPPLRERLSDLHAITMQLLQRIAAESGLTHPPRLGTSAWEALQRHPFPGNVRELENLLHRAIALSGEHGIEAEDLGLATPVLPHTPLAPTTPEPPASVEAEDASWAETQGHASTLPADLIEHLDRIERDILVRALEQHRFNRTAAGASLGLSLRQMRYRMARLGVQVNTSGVTIGPPQSDPLAEQDELPP